MVRTVRLGLWFLPRRRVTRVGVLAALLPVRLGACGGPVLW